MFKIKKKCNNILQYNYEQRYFHNYTCEMWFRTQGVKENYRVTSTMEYYLWQLTNTTH